MFQKIAILGNNIKKLREERGMSQEELAKAMSISRPSISTWENGKTDPSALQLMELAKIFSISLDILVGNTHKAKNVVVVDTSVLIKRPMIVEELISKFDEVLVPEVVISELNHIKDKKQGSKSQKSWLAMANLKKAEGKIQYPPATLEHKGLNDERILSIAAQRAQKSIADKVYIFSEDVYFHFLVKGKNLNNLELLTFKTYGEKFIENSDYDPVLSQEFFQLVKNGKLSEVKEYNLQGVDINAVNPETGLTPLIQAVRNRNLEMVKYLITLPRIDLDKEDKQKYKFTPLLHAAQLKDHAFNIFKLLIEYGADYERGSKGQNTGNTALMVSAWGGFKQGVEHLLTQEICANQQDTNGYTALIKACIKGHYEIALLLVTRTDVTIRCHENKKAEEYITKFDDPLTTKLIAAIKAKEKENSV